MQGGTREQHGNLGCSRFLRQRSFLRRLAVFWIYWDTAWSLLISGIMFATIVAHPDAEFAECGPRAG